MRFFLFKNYSINYSNTDRGDDDDFILHDLLHPNYKQQRRRGGKIICIMRVNVIRGERGSLFLSLSQYEFDETRKCQCAC